MNLRLLADGTPCCALADSTGALTLPPKHPCDKCKRHMAKQKPEPPKREEFAPSPTWNFPTPTVEPREQALTNWINGKDKK